MSRKIYVQPVQLNFHLPSVKCQVSCTFWRWTEHWIAAKVFASVTGKFAECYIDIESFCWLTETGDKQIDRILYLADWPKKLVLIFPIYWVFKNYSYSYLTFMSVSRQNMYLTRGGGRPLTFWANLQYKYLVNLFLSIWKIAFLVNVKFSDVSITLVST